MVLVSIIVSKITYYKQPYTCFFDHQNACFCLSEPVFQQNHNPSSSCRSSIDAYSSSLGSDSPSLSSISSRNGLNSGSSSVAPSIVISPKPAMTHMNAYSGRSLASVYVSTNGKMSKNAITMNLSGFFIMK